MVNTTAGPLLERLHRHRCSYVVPAVRQQSWPPAPPAPDRCSLLPSPSHLQVRSCLDLSVMWRSHHIEQSEEQGVLCPICPRNAFMMPKTVAAGPHSVSCHWLLPSSAGAPTLACSTWLAALAGTRTLHCPTPFLGPLVCRRQALHGRV